MKKFDKEIRIAQFVFVGSNNVKITRPMWLIAKQSTTGQTSNSLFKVPLHGLFGNLNKVKRPKTKIGLSNGTTWNINSSVIIWHVYFYQHCSSVHFLPNANWLIWIFLRRANIGLALREGNNPLEETILKCRIIAWKWE